MVGALDARPVIDEAGLVETHRYVGSRLHFIENPGWVSGGALEWLRALLLIADVEELDLLAADAAAGSDGLLFLPAPTGAMTPEWIAGARGCFYGLTAVPWRRSISRGRCWKAGLRACATWSSGCARWASRGPRARPGRRRQEPAVGADPRRTVTGLPVESPAVSDSSAVRRRHPGGGGGRRACATWRRAPPTAGAAPT